ncbi:MAG: DUF1569 domain-containing protein [bacterium]
MRNLFDTGAVDEIRSRLDRLSPDSERKWGTMSVAQVLAHCSAGFELASGARRPPQLLLGRILGWLIKPMALGNDEPMRRNSPTIPGLVMQGEKNFGTERRALRAAIDRFHASGPAGCTTHPHSFFGKLTPNEWAILMYKHLDHHFKQFGG